MAIKMLVENDPSATDKEKENLVKALLGNCAGDNGNEPLVVSIKETARLLGYKGPAAVRKAIGRGALKPFYGGKDKKRASGVIYSSIIEAVNIGGNEEKVNIGGNENEH